MANEPTYTGVNVSAYDYANYVRRAAFFEVLVKTHRDHPGTDLSPIMDTMSNMEWRYYGSIGSLNEPGGVSPTDIELEEGLTC